MKVAFWEKGEKVYIEWYLRQIRMKLQGLFMDLTIPLDQKKEMIIKINKYFFIKFTQPFAIRMYEKITNYDH